MIKIIAVGKIKEKYLSDAILEYKKRISKYSKLEIIEVKDIDGLPVSDILEKEGINILKYVKERDYVITLEIEGEKLTSIELADKIDRIYNITSDITFIIGGSYGLSKRVKDRSDFALSFSKMTFPHQLFRVMLLEQIYRAFKINNHETYHK